MEFLKKLPVSAHFKDIKDKWKEEGSFAIKAPTGSGNHWESLYFPHRKIGEGKNINRST